METGLSNLAFPRLNRSSIRSCDREEVELEGKEQKEREINNKNYYYTNCVIIIIILKITV